MGDLHYKVSTEDTLAQRFFDQGLVLSYGFNHKEAHRSFKQAALLHSTLDMAHWGQALVLGPNINAAMNPDDNEEPFDLGKDQLIPGRPLMLKNFNKIVRHQTEPESIEGNELTLKNGTQFKTDIVLWATGYRMDLSYLDLPQYNDRSPGRAKTHVRIVDTRQRLSQPIFCWHEPFR
ncbi:hypothetical protein RQM65_17300 [Pricia sp. S334]|uniref:Uncharacterized protein n=1 Tax=Pricia mediterranea TaxID=3076079 RepID=A0ABU3L9K5_9FLAO|nr:hypothetical protein [Pricia sp. S334]MDT7830429.1 hypothetical protein [Pricia sp. S334]